MENCTCSYCYHDVCFHPSRGDGAGLGVMCDGCEFEESDLPIQAALDIENTSES